jgi:hypothetical protein
MIPGLKHSVANLEAANAPAVVRVHAPTNQVATAIFIAVIVRVVAVIGVRSPAKSEKDMPVEPVMEAASASAETAKATAMEAATAAKMAATSAAMAAATTPPPWPPPPPPPPCAKAPVEPAKLIKAAATRAIPVLRIIVVLFQGTPSSNP